MIRPTQPRQAATLGSKLPIAYTVFTHRDPCEPEYRDAAVEWQSHPIVMVRCQGCLTPAVFRSATSELEDTLKQLGCVESASACLSV